MTLTNKQKHLAQTIDRWVKTIAQRGGGEEEILEGAYPFMATFKELLDISTQDEVNLLCETYPGFYRFAKLQELIAQGLQDGTISVDTPMTDRYSERTVRMSKLILLEKIVPICVKKRSTRFFLPSMDTGWFERIGKEWGIWNMSEQALQAFEEKQMKQYEAALSAVSPTFPLEVFHLVDQVLGGHRSLIVS